MEPNVAPRSLAERIDAECVWDEVHKELREKVSDESDLWAQKELLPTLVPALEALLTAMLRKEREIVGVGVKTPPLNPIDWLAQYLMRHNHHQSDTLKHHAYVVLLNAERGQVGAMKQK